MRKTLADIAKLVDGELVGDKKLGITGLRGIKEAGAGDLTFIDNPKYISLASKTKASAILIPRNLIIQGKTVIRTDSPSLAFAKIAALFSKNKPLSIKGIHRTAVIAKSAKLGKNVTVGPYAVIEDKARIGEGSVIHSGSFIGQNATMGKNCFIYPRVVIQEDTVIGNHVIIHSGAVIGSDGFGYVNVKGQHEKIPQIGIVVLEDDVEIGANTTIDRARFDRTIISRGTKIDNLVQIGHNVVVEENCIIISQVGISGSTVIKKNAILAGQSGVAGHLTVGEGAVVGAQAGVTKSVPDNTKVSGYPAKPHNEAAKVNACVQRLPVYVETINELKKRIEALEAKLK